ncbi:MAG: TIGR00270 family protein, partial [Nitrososphaeria archaeon]|nr:TIGR00270 family protein [Nitrososphaeria archaeon]NIQ32308.1 TIGR00270 family protein [Nitrososphaeria archaeon]
MSCEICGRSLYERRYRILMEGARLLVCERCKNYGTLYNEPEEGFESVPRRPSRPIQVRVSRKLSGLGIPEYDLIDDFTNIIRGARVKKSLTQKELAARINERLSVIQKVELGKLTPDLTLCKKLEHTLRVKLVT